MKVNVKKVNVEHWFLLSVFLLAFLWAAVQPFNVSPDEYMRYDIVEYLCKHGRLPHGGDPEIRNEIWGISYAFNPIVSYMISALFVKVAEFFTEDFMIQVIAARMVNVLFTTGTAWFTLKIGTYFFRKEAKWFFAILVTFLPGFLFVGSYVNTDAMALFSTAMICYSWVAYLEKGWTVKNSLLLGVGLSLCLLSYYNAYGWVLMSFLFFTFTALFCEGQSWDWKLWLKRGLVVAAVAAVLAGWWFVRNGILYQGDILGMRTSSKYAQAYAQDLYKPSNRQTMKVQGYSIVQMLYYQPKGWPHNWLGMVLVSFVGTFGYMDVFMPTALSKAYWLVFLVGALGMVYSFRMFGYRKKYVWIRYITVKDSPARVTSVATLKEWDKQRLFHLAMLGAMVIPPILLLIYAWTSDFQAQGRYLLPMLLPMMYFVTKGYENLIDRFFKKGKNIHKKIYGILSSLLVVFSLYTFFYVFFDFCRSVK